MGAPTIRTKYISNGRFTNSTYGYYWGFDSSVGGGFSNWGNISDTTSFGTPDKLLDNMSGWPTGSNLQEIEALRYTDGGTKASFQTNNMLELELKSNATEVDTEHKWYSIKIGTAEFKRADATYNSSSQIYSWTGVTTNPFSSTTGTVRSVEFTRQQLDAFTISDPVAPQAGTAYTTVVEITGWDNLETVSTGQFKSVFGIGSWTYIGFAVSSSNTTEPTTFSTATGTAQTISSTNRYVWIKGIINGNSTDNYYFWAAYPGTSNSTVSGGGGFFSVSDQFDLSLADYLVEAPSSINEGSAGTIVVKGENVPSAQTLYWEVSPASDFSTSTGTVSCSANTGSLAQIGSFTVTPTADQTTEFQETATISVYQDSARTVLLDSDDFIINDTSIDPGDVGDVWVTNVTEGSGTTSSTYYGYNNLGGSSTQVGALSDSTADMYSGANCLRLGFTRNTGIDIIFSGDRSGGWNSVKIKGREFAYSDFTRTYNSSSNYTRFTKSEPYNIFNTDEIVNVRFSTASATARYGFEIYPENPTEASAFTMESRYNYLRARGSRSSGTGTITVTPDAYRCTMVVWPQDEFSLGFNVSYSRNSAAGTFSYNASDDFHYWIVYR